MEGQGEPEELLVERSFDHGGKELRDDLGLRPTLAPGRVYEAGWLRGVEGRPLVEREGTEGLGLRRIGQRGGGGRLGRSRGRGVPLVARQLQGLHYGTREGEWITPQLLGSYL